MAIFSLVLSGCQLVDNAKKLDDLNLDEFADNLYEEWKERNDMSSTKFEMTSCDHSKNAEGILSHLPNGKY
jgi:hypothetical protein